MRKKTVARSGRLLRPVLASAIAAASVPALAADTAALSILGFSRDQGVFAFEEYGIQDGSGFPYSNIYAIDLAADRFVAGTPIRVRIDSEVAVSEARAQAAAKAAATLGKYGLAEDPGNLVAFNPNSEADSDPHRIRYYPLAVTPLFGGPYTLELEEHASTPSESCQSYADSIPAFSLRLTEADGRPKDIIVHAEDHVPESRGCVSGYRLGGVVTSQRQSNWHVTLVLVHRFGFEGQDGRWIALPVNIGKAP